MIKWIRSWLYPEILKHNIQVCPRCNRAIREDFSRKQQRRCQLIPSFAKGTHIFRCGRCSGISEYLQKPDGISWVFLRIVQPYISGIYTDVRQRAEDAQARYNLALAASAKPNRPPDITDFSRLPMGKLLLAIKRLERQTKNL